MSELDPPPVVVTKARSFDLEALAALHFEAFPADTGERWQRQDFAGALRSPEYRCLMAWRRDTPCGYALARFVGEECELLSLGVPVRWQRRGIGAALLESLHAACADAGVTQLFLEVREDNHAARAFYAKHGFEVVGRRKGYYRGRDIKVQDALTMARILL